MNSTYALNAVKCNAHEGYGGCNYVKLLMMDLVQDDESVLKQIINVLKYCQYLLIGIFDSMRFSSFKSFY